MKSILNLLVVVMFSSTSTFAQTDIYSKNGVALNGYDVVSYFNGKPTKGNAIFSADYEGSIFYFSSEENLNKFKGSPKEFLPRYGGYCAYAIAVKGKKVGINPETFEVKNGKLFLFYNKGNTNTLELWKSENPEQLEIKADANWQKIIKE